MAQFVFHLPRSWLGPLGSGVLPFYHALQSGLEARGFEVSLVALDRERVMAQVEADAAFHVVNHGRFEHPRVRNAGIAYVYPFWNMDPRGIRAFSSIGDMEFHPRDIDPEVARPFMRRMRKRLIGGRTSRYEQVADEVALPQGSVAVFLQSEAHRNVEESCFLDRWEMLEAVCSGFDGPVVVKPHPRDVDPLTDALLGEMCARFPHLQRFDGNIHDMLDAAERVVTINSAVGIEAFVHRKPVILCGRADFHHIADEAHSEGEVHALLRSPPRRRAYDKYIWWYFAKQCLSTTQGDLVDRFLERWD